MNGTFSDITNISKNYKVTDCFECSNIKISQQSAHKCHIKFASYHEYFCKNNVKNTLTYPMAKSNIINYSRDVDSNLQKSQPKCQRNTFILSKLHHDALSEILSS